MLYEDIPIPLGIDITGWDNVPIIECEEPLVSLEKVNKTRFCITAEYYRNNIPGSVKECYLRESAVRLLSMAANEMPKGWKFVVYDGWRPLKVQESIFKAYYNVLAAKYPCKQASVLLALTKKYVSLPSDNRIKPSPHNTGGAIDLSIRDASGADLDMGSHFDDFSEHAMTRYFEYEFKKGSISGKDHRRLANRRFLYHLLSSVGYTNYPEEWWHYDYGNQFWAKLTKQDAIYGAISL